MELSSHVTKPPELKDWAYQIIKDSILNLRFSPGAQLNIQDLTDQLDISRTPVREALLRLETEGLVRAIPRIGFFVTEITKRDLLELLELRELLEGYAAEKATPRLTDEEVEEIVHHFETSVAAAERGELQEFLQIEVSFHTCIIEGSGNKRLLEVMKSLNDLIFRERVLSIEDLNNVQLSCVEHERIVNALRERNAEGAGAHMREHLRNVRERLDRCLDLTSE